jgi:hypothetical protein
MYEMNHDDFHPLTRDYIDSFVPSDSGLFMLAIRLVSGNYQTFFTSQSDNLYVSLQKIIDGDILQLPGEIEEYLEKYQCYVTYFVECNILQRPEINKMLNQTADPVTRLKIINSN